MQGLFEFWDLYEWLWRLLFIEMGVLAGVLTKGNVELPSVIVLENPHKRRQLYLGSISQFIVGFAASFAFQMAGIELLMCWIYATGIGTAVNIATRVFTSRMKESEVKEALKKAMIALAEIDEMEKIKDAQIEKTLSGALREAQNESLSRLKSNMEIVANYPFKNGHKKLSEAMKERDKILSASYEYSPIPTIFFNRDGQIIASNKAMLQESGITRERNLSINLLKLKDKKLMRCVKRCLKGKMCEYKTHYQTLHSDGRIIPTHFVFQPLKEGKEVIGGMMIMDILGEHFYNGEVCPTCGKSSFDCGEDKKEKKMPMTVAEARAVLSRSRVSVEQANKL